MGRCCESVSNEKGVKWIQALDILFIVIVPRSLLAMYALCKPKHWKIYINIREMTFFIFWPIAFLTMVSYTLTNFLLAEEIDQAKVAMLSCSVVAFVIGLLVDNHFRKVINYFGVHNLPGIIEAE